MWRSIFLGEWRQDLVDCRVTDVHQHIGVRKPLHRPDLIPLCLWNNTIQWLSAVVFLQNLPIRYRCNPIVIEFEPSGFPVWFNERKIVPTVEVTRVYEDAVEVVFPRFGPIGCLVEELVKVNFEREFEAIIDLCVASE